jgi:hypothetical protein
MCWSAVVGGCSERCHGGLGTPLDGGRIAKRCRWPHRFGYGSVEVVACRCRLVRSFSAPTWGECHKIPGKLLGGLSGITLPRFIEGLAEVGCDWRLDEHVADQITLHALLAGSMVDFIFVLGGAGDEPLLSEPVLYQASAWVPGHECPPVNLGSWTTGWACSSSRF